MLVALANGMLQPTAGLAQKEKEDTCANPIYSAKEVIRRAKIKKITEPTYTDEARARGVQGTVIVSGVFCRDGKVTNIEVIQSLPYGLTENAVETTRHIEFLPAEKDGQSVSQRFRRECTFHLL